tara:strand:- start:4700 stop:4873 length:174 start_codon:yes stop_codon:yes gene_type:complete
MFIRKAFGCSSLVLHANTSLVVVVDAGHALLPEEPQAVAHALLECRRAARMIVRQES